MTKELIDYIREIHKVAGSQVGVYFGEKSPHHIREILRICEAAEHYVQADVCECVAKSLEPYQEPLYCDRCGKSTRR